jgi:hypothetical protein
LLTDTNINNNNKHLVMPSIRMQIYAMHLTCESKRPKAQRTDAA